VAFGRTQNLVLWQSSGRSREPGNLTAETLPSALEANYDGASTFSYQANSAGSTWNDFDNPVQRDLMMTYPTVTGVIDTIQWEGYREGQDDIRYATTLKLEIAKARNQPMPG